MAHVRQSRPDSSLAVERTWHMSDSHGQITASNMARVRQSRPDFGFGFQVEFITTFEDVPSSLGSGCLRKGNARNPR